MTEYLVKIVYTDRSKTWNKWTADDVFNFMDMDDCHNAFIDQIYRLDDYPRKCKFYGTWHNPKDPLRMEIRTDYDKLLEVGYGTDH